MTKIFGPFLEDVGPTTSQPLHLTSPRLATGSSLGRYGGPRPDAAVEAAARRVAVRQIS